MGRKRKDYQDWMVEMAFVGQKLEEGKEKLAEAMLEEMVATKEDCLKAYRLWNEVTQMVDEIENR